MIHVTHGRQQAFFQVRVLYFKLREDVANRPADGAGFLGTAARDNRCAQPGGILPGYVLRHIDQRTNEPEFLFLRIGYGWKSTDAAGEHRIAEERLAEIVRGMAQGDDIGAQTAADLVNRASTEAAAHIAAVARLLIDQSQARTIGDVRPIHPALLQVIAKGRYRTQELALFHSEGAHAKRNGSALL